MKLPSNYKTTSEMKSLPNGPGDMPNRGGAKPTEQTTSEKVTLSRSENPVANLQNKPGQGSVSCHSEQVKLSRTTADPYTPFSKTTPQENG